jgi:hypothetical protein
MTSEADRSSWYLWLSAAGTAVLILLAVPFARPVQNVLEQRSIYAVVAVITLGFIAAGAVVFRRVVWKSRRGRWVRGALFFAVCSVYIWRLKSLTIQVERFHLLEYGILAVLIALACGRKQWGIVSLGFALCGVLLIGMGDELFQYFWPKRVGEWRDVMINLESGVLALTALSILNPRKAFLGRSHGRFWLVLTSFLSILSIAGGMFILKVQTFGHEHFDPDIGRFRSFFTREELEVSTVQNYRDFLARIESGEGVHAGHHFEKYWFEREAQEHFDRTRLLHEAKRYDEMVLEYRITTRYFYAYLDIRGMTFGDDIVSIASTRTLRVNPVHLSSVVNWMVVVVNREQVIFWMWAVASVFGMFSLGIAIAVTRIRKKAS